MWPASPKQRWTACHHQHTTQEFPTCSKSLKLWLPSPEQLLWPPSNIILYQVLAQIALHQERQFQSQERQFQRLQASQQIEVQIEHFYQTGESNQIGTNQFKTRFDCPPSVCGCKLNFFPILDYFCLPCIIYQISEKLKLRKKSVIICAGLFSFSLVVYALWGPVAADGYDGENFRISAEQNYVFSHLPFVSPLIAVAFFLRGKLRKIRNIEGSKCDDCCATVFCTQGVVAQMWWEIN